MKFLNFFLKKGIKMNDIKSIIERMKQAYNVKTNKELAEKLGTSLSNIDNWKKRNNIPDKYLLLTSQMNGVEYNWLLTGEGEMYKQTENRVQKARELLNNIENNHKRDVVNVPFYEDIYASAGAGAYNHYTKAELIPFSVTFLEKFLNIRNFNGIHIITAVGDSMTPTIEDNDKLFVLPIENENNIIKDGGVYVISTPFGVLVKRIYLYPTKQEMILKSDNPNVKEEVIKGEMLKECKVIGRIVGIFKGRV